MELLTLNLHFPGKQPPRPVEAVEFRAHAGLLWAPQPTLRIRRMAEARRISGNALGLDSC